MGSQWERCSALGHDTHRGGVSQSISFPRRSIFAIDLNQNFASTYRQELVYTDDRLSCGRPVWHFIA